jgi:hypothetical protein
MYEKLGASAQAPFGVMIISDRPKSSSRKDDPRIRRSGFAEIAVDRLEQMAGASWQE